MLEKNIITKIALGVAVVAFIFSLITFIRALILGAGIFFAVIQLIGTLVIVAVCGIMLYVLRTEETEEDDEESETGENAADDSVQTSGETMSDITESEITEQETEFEITTPDKEDDRYNFTNFE